MVLLKISTFFFKEKRLHFFRVLKLFKVHFFPEGLPNLMGSKRKCLLNSGDHVLKLKTLLKTYPDDTNSNLVNLSKGNTIKI